MPALLHTTLFAYGNQQQNKAYAKAVARGFSATDEVLSCHSKPVRTWLEYVSLLQHYAVVPSQGGRYWS